MGSDKQGEMKYADPMMPAFRKMGAAAGAAKCLKELRTPIKKATMLMKKM
jgi:hypothetical protein